MKSFDVKLPPNKNFGYFFTIVFLLCGIYFFFENEIFSYGFWFLSILFFLVALWKPEKLELLNRLWMRIGLILGLFVSPIVLGIIFFLIFTPVGLLLRLFGRDELRLKNSNGKSFWIDRKIEDGKMEFIRQF